MSNRYRILDVIPTQSNTNCYCNSALVLLFYCTPFYKYIFEYDLKVIKEYLNSICNNKETYDNLTLEIIVNSISDNCYKNLKDSIIVNLYKFFSDITKHNNNEKDDKDAIIKIIYDNNDQQDVMEFINLIFDKIYIEERKISNSLKLNNDKQFICFNDKNIPIKELMFENFIKTTNTLTRTEKLIFNQKFINLKDSSVSIITKILKNDTNELSFFNDYILISLEYPNESGTITGDVNINLINDLGHLADIKDNQDQQYHIIGLSVANGKSLTSNHYFTYINFGNFFIKYDGLTSKDPGIIFKFDNLIDTKNVIRSVLLSKTQDNLPDYGKFTENVKKGINVYIDIINTNIDNISDFKTIVEYYRVVMEFNDLGTHLLYNELGKLGVANDNIVSVVKCFDNTKTKVGEQLDDYIQKLKELDTNQILTDKLNDFKIEEENKYEDNKNVIKSIIELIVNKLYLNSNNKTLSNTDFIDYFLLNMINKKVINNITANINNDSKLADIKDNIKNLKLKTTDVTLESTQTY